MLKIAAILCAFLVAAASAPLHAQVMLDVSKLTCWQFATYKVADPKLIASWISGFQHGKRGDTLVDTEKLDDDADKLRTFCLSNPEMPVMEAVEKVVDEAE